MRPYHACHTFLVNHGTLVVQFEIDRWDAADGQGVVDLGLGDDVIQFRATRPQLSQLSAIFAQAANALRLLERTQD